MTNAAQQIQKPTVQLGTIFKSVWGYDQTNVDFYEVVKVSGSMVSVRLVCQEIVSTPDRISNRTIPVAGKYYEDEILRKRIQSNKFNDCYIKINSYSWANLWDGKPAYATDSLSGH